MPERRAPLVRTPTARTSASTAAKPASAALKVLESLTVGGRGPKTGYSRAQFGPAWADVDHNGCDTRDDILNRDLSAKVWRAGTRDCVVLSGRFTEPYTGKEVTFSKAKASAVQIDHVVALSDAWQKGAAQWPASERLAFANDPLELLAVDGPTNEAKGDADAATWLPPNKSYRCTYVVKQISVKAKYHLGVTQAEHDAMARVLAGCGSASIPKPTTASVSPSSGSAGVFYSSCSAVRKAGKAPLYKGQPGYRAGLDADHNGVACQ